MTRKFWNWVRNEEPDSFVSDRTLYLDGEISDETWFGDEVTPKLFSDELHAGDGNITLWINSPGGDVFAAAQIYNMLIDYKGDVTVKIDGIAASAASVIAMAGTKVLMSPVAMKMIHNPMTIAMGDKAEMEKAIEKLSEVKESNMNAYEIKTALSRAKISHLMDAETWMDANKAVELGFADDILFQKEEQGSEGENEDPGADRTENGTSDSVMFSRRAVNNALMNKLEKHYGKTGKSVKDQAGIGLNGNGAEGDDPCNGCFGAAENACQKCEKKKVNTNVTGRSAEDLRERLNFIKKYI